MMEISDIIQWVFVVLIVLIAIVVIVKKVCRFSKGIKKGDGGCGCGCSGCDIPCAKRDEPYNDDAGKGDRNIH